MLLTPASGVALAALMALAGGTARQAEGAVSEKIVFSSNRTTGTNVNNPTGDFEIFKMNPDGTGIKQLTFNAANDVDPILSTDGTKIAYRSEGVQSSNPQGDSDVYVMNATDGSGKKNLTNNNGVHDYRPVLSPDGQKIVYESYGTPSSNPEGDLEIYRINALDGTGKKNLTNSGSVIYDSDPAFSPDGAKVSYVSRGMQTSNSDGDFEVYRMNALDGSGQTNLTNNPATDGVYVIAIR